LTDRSVNIISSSMPRRDTRSAIIEAAVTVLGRDGPDAFSAAALAREVGVSKATLFHHFPTIDEIPTAAFERMIADSLAIDMPLDASLADTIEFLGRGSAELVRTRRGFFRAYFVLMARAMFDARLRAQLQASGDALLARLGALLAPKLPPGADAAAFARLVAVQLDGSAIHRMAFGSDDEIDAAWKTLVDLARQEGKSR
jgi:AcrR family transcriptional regulator